MAETRSRSIRVEDELWERFCAISGTQNVAFRKLLDGEIRNEPDLAQKTYERAGRIEIMVEEVLELAQSVPNGLTTYTPAGGIGLDGEMRIVAPSALPKNASCKHCGERFVGPKFAMICPDCKSGGHTNDPRECPVCLERGTGAL
jgi:hypothetical protein